MRNLLTDSCCLSFLSLSSTLSFRHLDFSLFYDSPAIEQHLKILRITFSQRPSLSLRRHRASSSFFALLLFNSTTRSDDTSVRNGASVDIPMQLELSRVASGESPPFPASLHLAPSVPSNSSFPSGNIPQTSTIDLWMTTY